MKGIKNFFKEFKTDPGYYLRIWVLSMCGLAVVAFGVFCAVRATKIGIATASADEADAVVETGPSGC